MASVKESRIADEEGTEEILGGEMNSQRAEPDDPVATSDTTALIVETTTIQLDEIPNNGTEVEEGKAQYFVSRCDEICKDKNETWTAIYFCEYFLPTAPLFFPQPIHSPPPVLLYLYAKELHLKQRPHSSSLGTALSRVQSLSIQFSLNLAFQQATSTLDKKTDVRSPRTVHDFS